MPTSYVWMVFYIAPGILWFLLVSRYNRATSAHFPAALYAGLSLVPAVNLLLAWTFVCDLHEAQLHFGVSPVPRIKTYLLCMAIPYVFFAVGAQALLIVGAVAIVGGVPLSANVILDISNISPYLSFLWLFLGFLSLAKSIAALSRQSAIAQ
jgi:hypothetical protein